MRFASARKADGNAPRGSVANAYHAAGRDRNSSRAADGSDGFEWLFMAPEPPLVSRTRQAGPGPASRAADVIWRASIRPAIFRPIPSLSPASSASALRGAITISIKGVEWCELRIGSEL